MIRLIVLAGLALLLFFFFRWLSHQSRKVQWQAMAGLVAAVLMLFVVTGRAHWLAAVFAALLPFLRGALSLLAHLPLLQRILGRRKSAQSASRSSGTQTSTVRSRYIQMTLNHETGDIRGEVLEGQFKGRTLDQLQLVQLLQLLEECGEDDESAALLQAYLDRVYGDDWRNQAGEKGHRDASRESGNMTREEALQILGLSSDASESDIIQAHRRLMKIMHPDRGGSDYLAARINLAKKTLLAK